jgi:hypothetical protein
VLASQEIRFDHHLAKCDGNAENRVVKRVGRKNRLFMKKLIVQICLLLITSVSVYAQDYDDGYVTNGLPVNTSAEKYASYVEKFDEGMAKVLKGIITSNDQIIQEYGVNIQDFPKLSYVVATGSWSAYNGNYSEEFLRGLNQVVERSSGEYENILEVRNGLKEIASTPLSANEAEALAMVDISLQIVSRKFIASLTGKLSPFFMPVFPSAVFSLGSPYLHFIGFNGSLKLPGWLRCALGVLGEAIMGGFSGIKIGSAIGGPLGAAVVGIVGVAGGAFSGAAKYC